MEKTIIINAFEKLFVVASLLMFTSAIIPLLYGSNQDGLQNYDGRNRSKKQESLLFSQKVTSCNIVVKGE